MKTAALLLMLLLAQACASTTVGADADQLVCRVEERDAALQVIGQPGSTVKLPGAAEACEAGFEVLWTRARPGTGFVITAPSELGLRAMGHVYRIDFAAQTAVHIGELPATATRRSELEFSDVYQESGAIYMDRYQLSDSAVRILGTELELVLDGEVCVSGPRGAYRVGVSDQRQCERRVSATMQAPVCLRYRGDKAEVTQTSGCSELQPSNR